MSELKSPIRVRREASQLALEAARERESCGDPEGAAVIRDLAKDIGKIKLRRNDDARHNY